MYYFISSFPPSSYPPHLLPLTSLPHYYIFSNRLDDFVTFSPLKINRYFALPVDQAMLSNYSVYVRNPIDLSTIRARLGEELCTCLKSFTISHSTASVYLVSSYLVFMKQSLQCLLQRVTFQDQAKKCPLLPHKSPYRTPLLQVIHAMYC